MATSTHVRRSESTRARRADPAPTPTLQPGRRLKMAAACYLGIAVIVALTVLAAQVLPVGIGVPLFVASMAGVVAAWHPTGPLARVTRRN